MATSVELGHCIDFNERDPTGDRLVHSGENFYWVQPLPIEDPAGGEVTVTCNTCGEAVILKVRSKTTQVVTTILLKLAGILTLLLVAGVFVGLFPGFVQDNRLFYGILIVIFFSGILFAPMSALIAAAKIQGQSGKHVLIATTKEQIWSKEQWNSWGHGRWLSVQWKDALTAYECVILLDPNCAEAYGYKGNILRTLGRYEEALAALERATELQASGGSVFYDKGETLTELKRYEEALIAFDQGIQSDSDLYSSLCEHSKSRLLDELKRPEKP